MDVERTIADMLKALAEHDFLAAAALAANAIDWYRMGGFRVDGWGLDALKSVRHLAHRTDIAEHAAENAAAELFDLKLAS